MKEYGYIDENGVNVWTLSDIEEMVARRGLVVGMTEEAAVNAGEARYVVETFVGLKYEISRKNQGFAQAYYNVVDRASDGVDYYGNTWAETDAIEILYLLANDDNQDLVSYDMRHVAFDPFGYGIEILDEIPSAVWGEDYRCLTGDPCYVNCLYLGQYIGRLYDELFKQNQVLVDNQVFDLTTCILIETARHQQRITDYDGDRLYIRR